MGLLDYIKETIDLNRKYYQGQCEENSIQENPVSKEKSVSKEKEDEIWPFENDIDIKALTRAQQHERELQIQMYMKAYPFLE